jgi:hypothetical protein
VLVQHANDLRFRESTLSHESSLGRGLS